MLLPASASQAPMTGNLRHAYYVWVTNRIIARRRVPRRGASTNMWPTRVARDYCKRFRAYFHNLKDSRHVVRLAGAATISPLIGTLKEAFPPFDCPSAAFKTTRPTLSVGQSAFLLSISVVTLFLGLCLHTRYQPFSFSPVQHPILKSPRDGCCTGFFGASS